MNKFTVIGGFLMLGLGLGGGYWLAQNSDRGSAQESRGGPDNSAKALTESSDDAGEILFYRSPMNPDVTSPVPAKDEMGMDYIPVYASGDKGGIDSPGTITIDPVVVQNIGVRTATAERTSLSRSIRAVGRVGFDEESMARIHPKVDGWIENMRVDKTGQEVDKDEILLSLYSPKLVSTQQEYLLALNNLEMLSNSPFDDIKEGARELVASSRHRLELFDVPEHQIKELEETHKTRKYLHIHSPFAGTVIDIGVRQGQHVMSDTELYMIVNLERVWVYADVYEYELPWIRVGDEAQITLDSVPDKTFRGNVDYIYPYAERETRTTKARIIIENPNSLLRPNMFSDVVIHADTRENVVVIPAEAIIRSGEKTHVFVVREPGKFQPQQVTLGLESSGKVSILQGVEEGDEVVTSAQFLIDSESKLHEATAKMIKRLSTNENQSSKNSNVNAPKAHDHD